MGKFLSTHRIVEEVLDTHYKLSDHGTLIKDFKSNLELTAKFIDEVKKIMSLQKSDPKKHATLRLSEDFLRIYMEPAPILRDEFA